MEGGAGRGFKEETDWVNEAPVGFLAVVLLAEDFGANHDMLSPGGAGDAEAEAAEEGIFCHDGSAEEAGGDALAPTAADDDVDGFQAL